MRNTEGLEEDGMIQSSDDPQTQWLTFTLGNETYAVDVLHVQEVLRCPEISPVPGAPVPVLSIINLRGEDHRERYASDAGVAGCGGHRSNTDCADGVGWELLSKVVFRRLNQAAA